MLACAAAGHANAAQASITATLRMALRKLLMRPV
jgi:hypothetical protein